MMAGLLGMMAGLLGLSVFVLHRCASHRTRARHQFSADAEVKISCAPRRLTTFRHRSSRFAPSTPPFALPPGRQAREGRVKRGKIRTAFYELFLDVSSGEAKTTPGV